MKPSIPFYRVESITRPNVRLHEMIEPYHHAQLQEEQADRYLEMQDRVVWPVVILLFVVAIGYMGWRML